MAFVETTTRPKVRQAAIGRAADKLPDARTAVDRIVDLIVDEATDEEWQAGIGWYPTASVIAEELARTGGITHRQAAGIIAALSPQTGWAENIARAVEMVETGNAPHFTNCVDKAAAILDGADPFDVLRGRKVRSFFACILRPSQAGPVTVDRHAVAVVFGRPLTDKEAKVLERIGAYTLVASFYRAAARQLGISPAECQAIAWVTWRRLNAVSDHHSQVEAF